MTVLDHHADFWGSELAIIVSTGREEARFCTCFTGLGRSGGP
jgi:hypothetical protein